MGQWVYTLVTWICILLMIVNSSSNRSGWRPLKSKPDLIIGPRVMYSSKKPTIAHPCSLYKAVMTQHTFNQYIEYKHHIPDMKEFTLCMWHKLYNHSTDHPMFSYSTIHKPKVILSWIENSPKKSYYMLAVNGHTMYRINYPIKLYKWYHVCQSWNGKTGEWQLWVNGERTGRGYYNLMVGKPIKSGGVAITGQEKLDFGGYHWKNKNSGLQGEVTLVQLYKAALSKGKAYSDHKHHHVHEWGHDGEPVIDDDDDDDDDSGRTPNEEDTPMEHSSEHPFLENGQLKPRLPVHELLAKSKPKLVHNSELLSTFDRYNTNVFKLDDAASFRNSFGPNFRVFRRHYVYKAPSMKKMKRQVNATELDSHEVVQSAEARYAMDRLFGRRIEKKYERRSQENKRAFIINEHFPSEPDFPTLYSELNEHDISVDDPGSFFKNTIPDSGEAKIEYEPAEWEVKKIGEVCNACDEDPFKKANVLSWQETPKKLFAGAEYVSAIPKCHIF